MLKVMYEGKDISDAIELTRLDVVDSCGDHADGIDLLVANSSNQWSNWQPQKKHRLEIVCDGYSSGLMWVDRIRQEDGVVNLGAVSVPPEGKTKRSGAWEAISFSSLAMEKAEDYGLSAMMLSLPSVSYSRVDQSGRGDFAFLADRARLEGCSIKVQGNRLVIYSNAYMEGLTPAKTIDSSDFWESPRFSDGASGTYRRCTVSWQGLSGSFEDPEALGPEMLVTDVPVFNPAEAQRYAKNLLRNANKRGVVGQIAVSRDVSLTAGNTINISGMGLSDGKYFIDTAYHSFTDDVSRFDLHKCFMRF